MGNFSVWILWEVHETFPLVYSVHRTLTGAENAKARLDAAPNPVNLQYFIEEIVTCP